LKGKTIIQQLDKFLRVFIEEKKTAKEETDKANETTKTGEKIFDFLRKLPG